MGGQQAFNGLGVKVDVRQHTSSLPSNKTSTMRRRLESSTPAGRACSRRQHIDSQQYAQHPIHQVRQEHSTFRLSPRSGWSPHLPGDAIASSTLRQSVNINTSKHNEAEQIQTNKTLKDSTIIQYFLLWYPVLLQSPTLISTPARLSTSNMSRGLDDVPSPAGTGGAAPGPSGGVPAAPSNGSDTRVRGLKTLGFIGVGKCLLKGGRFCQAIMLKQSLYHRGKKQQNPETVRAFFWRQHTPVVHDYIYGTSAVTSPVVAIGW